MASPVHLIKRFFGAVRPGAPSKTDEQWALSTLSSAEAQIWDRMNNPDRRHAVQVARDVSRQVGSELGIDESDLDPWIVPAALLHDSGKVVSGFRTPARVVATVLWAVADDAVAEQWMSSRRSTLRRMAQYRNHPALGADLLRAADAHEYTAAWAEQHHLPASSWTMPVEIAHILKRCDDD